MLPVVILLSAWFATDGPQFKINRLKSVDGESGYW
jgi:hypothetical protein